MHWPPELRHPPQRLRLSAFPHDLDVVVRTAPAPRVGDAKVAVIEPEFPSAPSGGALHDWMTDAAPLRVDDVNDELVRAYGAVTPRFDKSALPHRADGRSASSPLRDLVDSLSPARRLALRAHLESTGLLDPFPIEASAVLSATEALRSLLSRVGDGLPQDPPTRSAAPGTSGTGW